MCDKVHLPTRYPAILVQVGSIDAKTLLARLQDAHDQLIVVDVRSAGEHAVSTIPQAITKDEFEQKKEDYKSATVVPFWYFSTHCHCSMSFRELLCQSLL